MSGFGWDFDKITEILSAPRQPLPKYVITDDRDEFISRLERINKIAFANTKDNLKYLEGLDKINQMKAGAEIETVFPWVKDLNR